MKEELSAQEALRGREREQKKIAEEEKQRIEETLRKSEANNDRLKEEREKLLQEKEKLWRSAETEMEILREELGNKRTGRTAHEGKSTGS
mgnify:CR=1 FL=1